MTEQINLNNYTKPELFQEKLDTLTSILPGILDEFKKAYLFYNKNPQNTEYQQIYESSKSNLNTFNSDVFLLSNNIEYNTEQLNIMLLKLNTLIVNEKQTNQALKKKISIVENKESAADELIYDYKNLYGLNYTKNWGLFLSIFLSGFAIYRVYKNKI
jgi:hypothetical protein